MIYQLNSRRKKLMKKIISTLLALTLVFTMIFASTILVKADEMSAEKQLFHLAVEDQLYGSYAWGESIGGVAFPDNSMAAAYGWPERVLNHFYNGAGWTSSGNVALVYTYAYITALGDLYQDATLLTDGLGNRGETFFAREVQLWKVSGFADFTNSAQVTTAMSNLANWELVVEVVVEPDKAGALADGKGFNWTTLDTPVLVTPGEVYVVVVHQGVGAEPGVWGNPRPNEVNNLLAIHPDNLAAEDFVGEIGSATDFYVSGAPIGDFANANPKEHQNAVAGTMYSGGNFKYQSIAPEMNAQPVASEVAETSATVTWVEASDSDVFGTVGGYKLTLVTGTDDPQIMFVSGKSTISHNLTDLIPETEYTLTVEALTGEDGDTVALYEALVFTTMAEEVLASPTPEPTTAVEDPTEEPGDRNSILLIAMFVTLSGLVIISKKTKVKS